MCLIVYISAIFLTSATALPAWLVHTTPPYPCYLIKFVVTLKLLNYVFLFIIVTSKVTNTVRCAKKLVLYNIDKQIEYYDAFNALFIPAAIVFQIIESVGITYATFCLHSCQRNKETTSR